MRSSVLHPARRGFTIIETVLAVVVGGMVLLGCVSVFITANRAERVFADRFERTGELWTTQLAVRRTFMQLLLDEQAQTAAPADQAPTVRPRIILQADPGAPADAGGWRPQRLEVTVARSPVPSILGSRFGSWLVEQDRADSLDFTSTDLSSGAIRGVFELRPAGTRELIMASLGLAEPDEALALRMETDPLPGWTLWWRPILSTELAELEAGYEPRSDAGSGADLRDRLAGAIPILTGVESLQWQVFKGDERILEYAGTTITDLPAFVELEIVLNSGRYANWMFEVGWTTGEDPTTGDPAAGPDDDQDNPDGPGGPGRPGGPDGPGGDRPGGDPPGGDRPGGDRPGGSRRPGGNTFDIGGGRR